MGILPVGTCYDPAMKIAKIESLHADAGHRNLDVREAVRAHPPRTR
jgi:hypothetical protein